MVEDEVCDVGRGWVVQYFLGHMKEFGFYSKSIRKLSTVSCCGVTL